MIKKEKNFWIIGMVKKTWNEIVHNQLLYIF